MSSDGETIVGTMRDGGVTEAFRWTSTIGTQRIGLADTSAPPMTTADGLAFVGLSDFGGSVRPFRWTSSSGMVPLEPSPPCDFGFPCDVTDDASTVPITCQIGTD